MFTSLPLLLSLTSLSLAETKPSEAYFVRCDRSTMTQIDGADGIVDLADAVIETTSIDLDLDADELTLRLQEVRFDGPRVPVEINRNIDILFATVTVYDEAAVIGYLDEDRVEREAEAEITLRLTPLSAQAEIEDSTGDIVADILFSVEVVKVPGLYKLSDVTLKRGVIDAEDELVLIDMIEEDDR